MQSLIKMYQVTYEENDQTVVSQVVSTLKKAKAVGERATEAGYSPEVDVIEVPAV